MLYCNFLPHSNLLQAGLQLDDEGNYPVPSDASVHPTALASQTNTVSATRQKAGATSPKRKSAPKKRGTGRYKHTAVNIADYSRILFAPA